MLVPAMTNEEITKELIRDSRKIKQVQMPQLLETYIKERKRFKIDRRAIWAKEYIIELPKTRNTWMLVFQKSPSRTKYSDACDVVYANITWYYGPQGLRAFRPAKDYIEVFNAHLFNRYNERMNLNLPRHVDIMKHFFCNSSMAIPQEITHNGKEYTMSVSREGATLGNYRPENPLQWLVNNTFITHGQMHKEQVNGKGQIFDNILDKMINYEEDADDVRIEQIKKQVQRIVNQVQAVA